MRRRLRVLCTSTGGAGHVHALAPVARALRDRGHDVRWAVAADGGGAVGAMGFEWSAAGLTTSARRDAAAGALGGLMQLPMEERRGPLFAALFARAAGPAMREDLAFGAASHGRSQLVVPLFADQWENGVAVDDAGCGIVLGPTRRGIEDLEQALRTVLTGSSHREAAIRVADEIAAMPTATDLAPDIEALVGT